jgi:glutamate carboxypeptidase
MKKIQTLALALLLFNTIFSQSLTDTEKKIIEWIKGHTTEAEKLLEETVNINSGTFNIAGVKKTGEIFARELQKAGLVTEWVPLPDSLKRAGHLVASKKGTKGKKIFIIGHLDTVFEPDMPAGPFTRLNDSTATGQGVNDMKGGDVIVVMALQALHSMNLLKDASIVVYFTGDEEESGKPVSVSRKDFIERARNADLALAFETAQGMNTIAIGRRGFSSWKLDVTAKTGHSAGVFGQGSGYGAIYETARILNRFREELGNEKYLTFNPGIIAGGSEMEYDDEKMRAIVSGKTNIISPSVVVEGDLRFLTEKQRDAARQKMSAIVSSQHLNGTAAKISFTDGIPSMEPTKGNDALRLWVDKVSRDMGLGPANAGDPGSRGAGDISYVAKYMDCIDGLGASGRGAHAEGETINLKQFPLLIQRAALLIYRLTQSE